jgi:hypothetical protein
MKRGGVASSDVSFTGLSVRASQEEKRRAGLRGKRGISALLLGAALGASQFAGSAHADEQQLQHQIDVMKRQLEKMEHELAQKKQAPAPRVAGVPAGAAPVTARNGNEIVIPAPSAPPPVSADGQTIFAKALPSWVDGIHFSMAGSFIAMEGAYRQHSEVSDGASSPAFGSPGIPLQNSALYNEREFRASAQQSRIAMKAWGDIDPNQHVKGYYEMDFLGASTDANNRESNSFTPRIRQAFAEYDNDLWHFHFVGGQAWSFLTQNRVGALPNSENVPLTIDAQYVVGFDWLRNPQLRFVYDFNKIAWFGVSIEQPQAVFPGAPSTVNTTLPAPIVASFNNNCTGGSHLNGTTQCSNDVAPDVIEKFALDPGFGHYEVLGVERWFSDEINTGAGSSWSQKVTMGWGVGGNALLPAIPKVLDLQGSVLYGQGIGRYTSSQLPDAVLGPDGTLSPITMLSFMVGAVAHPFEGNDIYTYYGEDKTYANSWTSGVLQGGWGNPNYLNNGCVNPNLTGGTLGGFNTPAPGSTCSFNVQKAQEFTIGFWQDAYKGNLGRLRYGLQYEYVRLTAFQGAPGPVTATLTPNQGLTPNNNILMFSFRYYPFN